MPMGAMRQWQWCARSLPSFWQRPCGMHIISMSARTMTVSRIVMVPAEDVREVMMQDPAFARNVIEELAACYRGLVRHTKNLKLRNTRERIAAYLLRQSRVLGNVAGFTLTLRSGSPPIWG